MDNPHLSIVLIILIVINATWGCCKNTTSEGFSLDKINPVKLIDRALGKLVDSALKSNKDLKPVYLKVKKERSLLNKIKTTIFELFILLLTIIFMPIAAIFCLYLISLSMPYLTAFAMRLPSLFVAVAKPLV